MNSDLYLSENSSNHPLPIRLISTILNDKLSSLQHIYIEGEIINITCNSKYFYTYITVRDLEKPNTIQLISQYTIFNKVQEKKKFNIGDKVIVLIAIKITSIKTALFGTIISIDRVGLGDFLARIEQLKTKLYKEGLFDDRHKKPIRRFPNKIGLICGNDAAAKKDVIVNSRIRWFNVEFIVHEVPIQGNGSVNAIINALLELDNTVDTIILTRGGGSFEDLIIFSEERLVRTLFQLNTPVVTAIGHEKDVTLSDYVSDLHASTPTDSAIKATPSIYDEQNYINATTKSIKDLILSKIKLEIRTVSNIRTLISSYDLTSKIENSKLNIYSLMENIYNKALDKIVKEYMILDRIINTLSKYDPNKILILGYAILKKNNIISSNIDDYNVNDKVEVQLYNGRLLCTVIEKDTH